VLKRATGEEEDPEYSEDEDFDTGGDDFAYDTYDDVAVGSLIAHPPALAKPSDRDGGVRKKKVKQPPLPSVSPRSNVGTLPSI
jgi:hypothetical protein